VLARLDPQHLRLTLVPAFTRDQRWTIDSVEGDDVAVALDAGQFRHSMPYGWVVSGGHELLKPEYAPLAGAVVVYHDGTVRLVPPDRALEHSLVAVLEAFQSYPMLLMNGVAPPPLHQASQGVKMSTGISGWHSAPSGMAG